MIKYVLSDLDNTLNTLQDNIETQNSITALNVLAVESLKKNNIEFGIVSGNSFDICLKQTQDLITKPKLFICQNGCNIYYDNKLIYEQYFDYVTLKNIINFLDLNKYIYVLEGQNNIEYYPENISKASLSKLQKANYNSKLQVIKNSQNLHCYKIQVKCFEKEKIPKILENIKFNFPLLNIVRGDETTIDLTDVNVNKAQGIKKMCDLLNLDVAQIAYFGDNYNDLCAFDLVKESFIMANSSLELQKKVKYIVANVAQGVEIIINKNK